MTDPQITRRLAILGGATVGGAVVTLASREANAAPSAHKWEPSYRPPHGARHRARAVRPSHAVTMLNFPIGES